VLPSALLTILPTVTFVSLIAPDAAWTVPALALLALALASLALALCTEPGLLHNAPPDDTEGKGRRPRRTTHVLVDGERCELAAFRAKMCRQTENCVEDFDHYCPWVGNAVGRRNYRFFIAFVSSTALLSLVVCAGSVFELLERTGPKHGKLKWSSIMLMVLVGYTLVVLCSVSSLLCYHARLISINQTTNENIRGTYYSARNPHDRGAARNCANFFCRPVPPSRVNSFIGEQISVDDEEDAKGVEMV